MLYPYMTIGEELEVCHSHLITTDGKNEVIVHFECPTENGFNTARCTLPDYNWTKIHGFSQADIEEFEEFLRYNAHLIFRYAESGGIKFA